MINSICIIRLSALGDVMMLVPLIRTLQRGYPQAEITWIISRPAYDLVAGLEGVSFIVIDKPKHLKDYWRFKQDMKNRKFDVLLALQTTLRANLLYPLINAKRKIGFDMPKRSDGHGFFVHEKISLDGAHTVDVFLKFAEALGLKEKKAQWDLNISDEDQAWAAGHLPTEGRILVVNPAASKPERAWPVSRMIETLQKAMKRWPLSIVLTGGPGQQDRQMAEAILKALPALDLVGKTKPQQLLAVISQADALLCPDTGPSHMAVAVNTPVIALHAVTNPAITGPYTCQDLVVNQFPFAQESILGKRLEDYVWGEHVHGEDVMKLISVEEVLDKLALVFHA